MSFLPPPRREAYQVAALFALELACLLVLAEAVLAFFDVDTRLLGRLLYYQGADTAVHMLSEDPALHYELKPGASAVYENNRIVAINSLGFRDPPRSREKPPGTMRIICLGSSNLYGALVQNDQTYPAMLEKLLNSRLAGKYEVWNGGVSAYVIPQNLAAAAKAVREYSPDLLIFQLQNCGRRSFLYGQPFSRFFSLDPGLYAENLRFYGERAPAPLRRLRLFRAALYLANLRSARRDYPGYMDTICRRTRDAHYREFMEFYAGNREKVRFAFLSGPEGAKIDPAFADFSATDIPVLDLQKKLPRGHGPEYLAIHPPARVYRWYAEALFSCLEEAGLLPRAAGRKNS
ncbi:MAG TPA: hypothetical protein PKI19_06715 [Elusimicrobiales bacterium]|nr:hypothetical protein [Elusimicrobiales bacterium]